MDSYLVIGDLHGRHDLLKIVLQEIAPQVDNASLVFLGDYIDRGPDSAAVIEQLIQIRGARAKSVILMGNHEKALLKLLDSPSSAYWADNFLLNGGQATLDSYGLSINQVRKIPTHHQKFMRSLPLYWQSGNYVFVHAGLRPGVPLKHQDPQDMLTIRAQFYKSNYPFSQQIVFGHTTFTEPWLSKHCLGIDTGAVYGQRLTCLWLPHMKFFTIDSNTLQVKQDYGPTYKNKKMLNFNASSLLA